MKHALLLFLLFNSLSVAAQDRQRTIFDGWDSNGDGRLTKNELPAGARANFEKADRNGDGFISREEDSAFRKRSRRGLKLADSIDGQLDQPYAATKNPKQRLDLYLPKKRKNDGPLPVVAFIHGGGWRNGDKAGGRGRVLSYAGSGEFAGVSIGYRLSGEAKWPAQIHDCKAAIRWLKANAKRFNLDPDRIGVMGSSAGGHLVAMLGATGDVKSLEGNLGDHLNQNSRVACVVDEYGPTNFLTMNDFPGKMNHNSPTSPESLLIGGPIQENKDKCNKAGPLMYVSKNDPPFLIVHGTKDPLVPFNQSVILAEKLKAAGVPFILQEMTDGEHGGFRSEELARRQRLFFENHLLRRKHELPDGKITVTRRTTR